VDYANEIEMGGEESTSKVSEGRERERRWQVDLLYFIFSLTKDASISLFSPENFNFPCFSFD